MLTRIQISKLLAGIFVEILPEMTPTNIRRAYQHSGMPAFKDGEDYLYYWLSTFEENFQVPTETKFYGASEQMSYTAIKGITCNVSFYGDNAGELALKLEQLSKNKSFMKPLRLQGVFLINNTQTPRTFQELVNNQWYLRADLLLRFYQKVEYTTPINRIDSLEVNIYEDGSGGDPQTGFLETIYI